MSWKGVVKAGLEALVIRLHVESCKECRKKYNEISKHAFEEFEKREAAKA